MKTSLYVFSGTGSSLAIAKKIRNKLGSVRDVVFVITYALFKIFK